MVWVGAIQDGLGDIGGEVGQVHHAGNMTLRAIGLVSKVFQREVWVALEFPVPGMGLN